MIPAVRVVPVGELDAKFSQRLARALSGTLRVPCGVGTRGVSLEAALLEGRLQYDADRLLASLQQRQEASDSSEVLLGVTESDVGVPIFTFVFGRAVRGGGAALISLARLRPEYHGDPPDEELALRRAKTEALHELGHVAGLPHCPDHGCLMHFASSVEAIEVRGDRFCPECARAVPLRSSYAMRA